jgi:hypothetical protein
MATLTLSNFRTAVYDRLEQNTRFYTSAEITRCCNDAVRTLNIFTGFITGSATFVARANCHIYNTPPTILVPTRVQFDGRDLEPIPLKDLIQHSPRWLQETTTNFGPVSTWSAVGLHLARKLVIHPASANGGALVKVFGVTEPTELVDADDEITLPTEYADILYALAAHEAMMKCGGVVARDAMLLYTQFLKRMTSLKRFQAKVNPRFWVEAEQKAEN